MCIRAANSRSFISKAVACLVLLMMSVGSVQAHEEYVVNGSEPVNLGDFYSSALSDPMLPIAFSIGGIAVLGGLFSYRRFRPFTRDIEEFRAVMREYIEYMPWLLRISLGVPLIGAGFSGYFISPAVELDLRILQVAVGFFLLFGLATRAVSIVGLFMYLGGLLIEPQILLQFEYVGGFLALALLGSGMPSGDHTLQRLAESPGTFYGRIDPVHQFSRWFQQRIKPYEKYLPTVVRLGLGSSFIYLGLTQKLLNPGLALAVVEQYNLTSIIPVSAELWVIGAGLSEVVLGTALIVGLYTRATAVAALGVFTLTLFALSDDPVLAHVSLFGMASVLVVTGGGPFSLDARWDFLAPNRR